MNEEVYVDFEKIDFDKMIIRLYGTLDGFEDGPYYDETKEEYLIRYKEFYGYSPEEIKLIRKYIEENNLF